ncbi:MAG: RAMP superfamily CRISPR-associated protein [Thermoanaerobaculia bacterium]
MAEGTLDYRLVFRSPVSVFTGLGIAGMVDRVVVRDARGLPHIPGSTVKGRLRFFAERVLRTATIESRKLHLHPPDGPHCKQFDPACTVCRMFGNPAVEGAIRVGQATLPERTAELFLQLLAADPNPVLRPDAEVRPGIAVSRHRRGVIPDHLFFDETVPAVTFHGKIGLRRQLRDDEMTFLAGVGRLVDALGARKVAGRGGLDGGIRIEVNER